MRVVVLGGSGMLGSMAVRVLSADAALEVVAVGRPAVDAETASAEELARALDGAAWAINAIGVIKTHIRDAISDDVTRAVRVNALFPHALAEAARRTGTRVIQIATDCVYSGDRGRYVETDLHDARDVYGKTKSLGEVRAPHVTHLRSSIVGPERRSHTSLLDWFRQQPPRAAIQGYTNHHWNGVTTLHFAKLCLALIREAVPAPALQHVVPADAVTKDHLLHVFASAYGRTDVTIAPTGAPQAIDRTIATSAPAVNHALWRAAGYASPPTIEAMVQEMAEETRGL
jgi:dTDP-4-dehydrorhamnose reductase